MAPVCFFARKEKEMRKARSKIREKLAGNRAGSEQFAMLLEEAIENQELQAEYEAIQQGLDYRKMSDNRKREFLCEMFSAETN